jgi:hypothetical protein
MAHFKPILGNLSGSIASDCFSHNRYGAYVRNRTVPTDPSTSPQVVARASFSTFSSLWRGITESARQAWQNYASSTPKTNPFGDTVFLAGNAWFVAYNTLRTRLGLTPAGLPPTLIGLAGDPGCVFTADSTAGLELASIVTVPLTTEGGILVQWAGPKTESINFFKGPFPAANSVLVDSATVLPLTIVAGASVNVGDRFFIRIHGIADLANDSQMFPPSITQVTALV